MKKLKIEKLKNSIFLGSDFNDDLDKLIKICNLKNSKIVLFIGQKIFKQSMHFKVFLKLLAHNNIQILEEVQVYPNPTLYDIKATIKKIRGSNIDFFFSIGGGSVIDYAKACKMYSKSTVHHVVIYTNTGSASIVSPFVVYDNHEFKIGDFSEAIVPDHVYINTEILKAIPHKILDAGICDIYGHSCESYLSKISTSESKKYATKSISRLMQYFSSKNIIHLIYADIYAGISEAVGIVLLPHALGHLLTYKYKISHGYAGFVFLNNYIKFLKQNNIKIPNNFSCVMNIVNSLKIKRNFVIPRIECMTSDEFRLVKRYMGFAFDNSPIVMKDEEIIEIFNSSVTQYEKN